MTSSHQTISLATAAVSSPVWVPVLEGLNPVLTAVLTGLGIILTLLKIRSLLKGGKE